MPKSKQILKNKALYEIFLSSRNPIHFINNYCKIQHPTRGLIPFLLYDYQAEAIKNFLAYDRNIINKARQLGFSTLWAAVIVWLILFHKDKSVLVVSTRADVARNLVKKVKIMLRHIPDWMYLAEITTNQAHQVALSNGSSVKSVARGSDVGRSEAASLVIIDEAAHIRDMEEVWKGIASVVATGGKIVVLSTPLGINWFYQYCREAMSGENGWHYQEVYWWSNPEYSEGLRDDPSVPGGKSSPWFERQTAGWSRQQISQELLTSFVETGETFLDPMTIKYYQENTREPIRREGQDRGFWIFKDPEPKVNYLVGIDVSSGTAEDFSTAVVLDARELEVVAEYKGKMPPDVFGEWLVEKLGPMYNNAFMVPENNSLGMVTAFAIKNADYKNLAYIDEESGRLVDKWVAEYKGINPGFRTTAKTRPIVLQKMEEYLRKNLIKSHSIRMVNEFLSFVWKNGKAQHRKGCNDDLIIALAIAVWMRETFFHYESRTTDDLIAMYDAMIINTKKFRDGFPGTSGDRATTQRRRIRQVVENQKRLRLGNRVINMDWIHKL